MGGSVNDLVPELQPWASDLLLVAGRAGLQPRVTSTIRTNSEQRRLYNRYLAGQAGYPVVPPGQSAHEYGLAFDLVVSPLEALADVGYTWVQWGGAWNGNDAVHFELPGASEWARSQGSAAEQKPLGQWIDQFFGGIPWYISALLPISLMTRSEPIDLGRARSLLAKFGIRV